MSLRDTIEGARDEAKANADGMTAKAKAKEEKAEKADVPAYDPFSNVKSSAAGAKPAREAAASVRMEGERPRKSTVAMTKEEKKAAKAEERRLEDLRNQAYDFILRDNGAYKKTDRTWWILLGTGFAFTIASLLLAWLFPDGAKDYSSIQGIGAVVTLVLAYGFIIAAFIYDLRKRRPYRKAAEKRLQGMSDKKVEEYLEAEWVQRAKEADKKDSKKSA